MAAFITVLAVLIGFTVLVRAQTGIEVTPQPIHEKIGVTPEEQNLEQTGYGTITDVSKHEIQISLTYKGDLVQFFGMSEDKDIDAVISVLRSPAEEIKINQAGRVGPFWMNTKQHVVKNVPFMYKINASRPLDQIMPKEELAKLEVGIDSIKEKIEIETIKGGFEQGDRDVIFDGLVRLKKDDDLYSVDDEQKVVVKEGRLYRHEFEFPSATKEGSYIIDTYLVKDGKVVGRDRNAVSVEKVGIESLVVHWANGYPKLYGVCAVIIALGAGILVGTIFKGGAH